MSFLKHTVGTQIRRNLLIPFYWKYINRSNVLNYYEHLRNIQWNSMEKNREIQRKKLFKLIQYAQRNISYYQQIIREYGIKFSEETIFEDIKKFPLLTKDVLRKHFSELYRFRNKTYYRNTSGGSTGEPVLFYQDKEYLDWANASKRLFNEWASRKIGEPMLKLWGSQPDILEGGRGFKGYLRQQISGITTLGGSKMSERDMAERIININNLKPRLILAYTNVIDELARFAQRNHLSIYSPCAVMTTAGVLFPELKARIKEVFHTNVFNRYGSREVSDMACNCEKDEGLHLLPTVHYLEIVDDEGKPVKPDNAGNIIVTLLNNYTMPLIRYKIEDSGVLSDKRCSCGRGFPLLESVEGRITDKFKNKFGDYVGGGIFFEFFYYQNNIRQFQIIQEKVDFITINLVLNDKSKFKDMNETLKKINQKICKIMGHETKVEYNILDEIEPGPSGKYNYSFSLIKKA